MKHRHHKSSAETAPSQTEPVGPTGRDLISSLKDLLKPQDRIEQSLQDLSGQNAFLRQQLGQLYDAVRQLYGAVSAQCVQLRDSDSALQEELRKFQTGGPQRAMAGVFHKLFRDMLKHMNQLDDLVRLSEQGEHSDNERPWMEATRVVRDNMESLLLEWGCTPIPIQVGQDAFDPEIHEAVKNDAYTGVQSCDGNRVVKVVRRGWRLGGTLVQHPQVIVS